MVTYPQINLDKHGVTLKIALCGSYNLATSSSDNKCYLRDGAMREGKKTKLHLFERILFRGII